MTPDASFSSGPATSPARTPVRWSGRKTAVGAALAIGIAAGGGVAAAQVIPQGSFSVGEQHGPGHGGPGQPPEPMSVPGGGASPDAILPGRPEDDSANNGPASTSDV